eukprot:34087_1
MSWFGSEPQISPLLEQDITCSCIEFRKLWTDEEKYQLSHLKLVTSNDICRDWFYHDLKGISLKAPLFANDSIIGSCNFTREHGENHTFHGVWEGEMKPNDTVSCSTSTKHSITIQIRDKSQLGQYIKDPNKSSEFKEYKNKFRHKNEFVSDDFGELELEITKNEYYRMKHSDTIWAKHKIKIPKSMIVCALKTASIATKPEIIEEYVEPKPKQLQEEKSLESAPKYEENHRKSKLDRVCERVDKIEDEMRKIELKMNKGRIYFDTKTTLFVLLIAIGVWFLGKDTITFWNFSAALLYATIIFVYFTCFY